MNRCRHRAVLTLLAVAFACRPARDEISSPDPECRAAAVARLATSRVEADLPALLVAQDDPSALVRKAAAGAFAARGGPAAVEALGKLVCDSDSEVACAAARALSALPSERRAKEVLVAAYSRGGPAARAEIATALRAVGGSLREAVELEARETWERNVLAFERGTPAERAGAAEELGRSGRAEAVRLLVPLLEPERHQDRRVVAAAARALGTAGDRSARTALETLLKKAPDAALAESAAEALGALADPAAADALASVGEKGSERLAAAAARALAVLPQTPEVATALCSLAHRAQDPGVAARAAAQVRNRGSECPSGPLLSRLARRGADTMPAVAALGYLRLRPDALAVASEHVQRLLPSTDPALRTAAIRALGRMGAAKATPALARRAADAAKRLDRARKDGVSTAVRDAADELAAALVAVARLRAEGAAALARARLSDPSATLRAAAVEALGTLGHDQADRIEPALRDPDRRVWTAAAEALGRMGPSALPALAHAARVARPDDPELWAALARALDETGSPEAVPALALLLTRSSAEAAAAAALGRIGTKEAAAALLASLSRPDFAGRAQALDALGGLGTSEAGRAIAAELTSDSAEVRAAAARALGRLRHDTAGGRLEALRSDYDGRVRRAAVEALSKLPMSRVAR